MANGAVQQAIGVGRRKRSVARVYLRPGSGKITINGKSIEDFFNKRPHVAELIAAPLRQTQQGSKFDLVINVKGGGTTGQAEAIRHGCARALEKDDPERRPVLKKAGFLTRDAREVERKKPGQPKARKRFQFSKR